MMEYPRFTKMTFSILEHQLDWLNRHFAETAVNRSVAVREAIELLMAKHDGKTEKGEDRNESPD